MLKTAARWSIAVLSCIVFILVACAAAVFIVDPFEHYRESSVLPLYDQESYNNPGIARNYDYDTVVLGTSMVEMMNPSLIDECFGVNTVKLPMRGSFTSHMGYLLEHVFRFKPDLEMAILGIDAYSLVGLPDNRDEIIEYLWNDDPFDDVQYLLNRDVLFVRIPRMIRNIGKDTAGKRDAMYKWTDVVYSEANVLATTVFQPQAEMKEADYRIELAIENINRHLRPYIQAHPETKFKLYMPPYSAAYWYSVTRMGISEQQYRLRALVCEMPLEFENVEIYDYSSCIEWIEELDQYFDYSHHSSVISDRIVRAMAAGERRVMSVEDMEAGSDRLREAVLRFAEHYEPLYLK